MIFLLSPGFILYPKVEPEQTMQKQPSTKEAHFTSFGLTSRYARPRVMANFHWHNEVELNLVEAGAMTYLFGGFVVTIPPNCLAVFWGVTPHRLVAVAEETRFHVMTLPLVWFLQWRLPSVLANPVLQGELVVGGEADPPERDGPLIHRWHQNVRSEEAERHKIVLLEMEARLRRMALTRRFADERGAAPAPPTTLPEMGKVEQITRFVAEHYDEPLDVSQIARAVGLHPNYAMSLFRKLSGMSLLDYVTRHRVSHAQRLLATTDDKVVDIAFASGFGSVSRFYVVFQRACGLSPNAYRASLRFSGS